MRIVSLLMAGALAAAWTGPGQGGAITVSALAGDWAGELAGQLPLVLHLRLDDGGKLTATVDSPAQGATGLKADDVRLNGTALSFTVPVVHGTYSGTVGADGKSISGSWSQGKPLPLVWKQTATTADLAQVKPSPIDGDWGGVLRAQGRSPQTESVSLRVIFHFHGAPGGGIACSMDSPDQGAMAIACSGVKLSGRAVTVEVPVVHGSYQGTLSADGMKITGTWTQGTPHPLDLTRSTPAAEPRTIPAGPPVALKDLQPLLERDFAPVVAEWPQGAVVVAVLDHGQREVMAFGAAKPDSIFEIGSVTKTFTALALAQMVVQKKVMLDEPVRELLPAGTVAKPKGPEISLLDLATQHSGLPRLPDNLQPASQADPYADYTPQRLDAYLAQHGLGRPEKPEFLYSNLGVGLLGYALALRAGVPYGELIRETVTGPLDLRDTAIRLSPEQQKRFVQGYSAAHDPVSPWNMDALAGAGALRSTAGDLLTYCAALMHADQTGSGRTGEGATLAQAIPMVLEPRADVDAGGRVRIAMAWMVRPAESTWWHDGGTGGFTALVSFEPEKDRAIVVLYNCEDMTPGHLPMAERVTAHVSAMLEGKPVITLSE